MTGHAHSDTWRSDTWRSDTGRSDTGRSSAWQRLAFGLIGAPIAAYGIAATDPADIGRWGLVEAVPAWYYLGTGLIAAGVVHNLVRPGGGAIGAAWAHLLTLVVVFHGVAAFAEPNPRFPVAWLHVAFVDHVAADGELLPYADARFSWPGFFTASAYLQRLVGSDTLLWALALAPAVVNIALAVVVFDLARTLGLASRRATVAAFIVVLVNWIAQDYFAPQAIALILVFVLINLVLRYFTRTPDPSRFVNRMIGTYAAPQVTRTRHDELAAYVVCLTLIAALVVSHQLSPVMLVAFLIGLGFVQRVSTPRLGWITALLFAGWLTYAAEAYWIGHFDVLFGSVGNVSSVVQSNVSERSRPSGIARQTVVRLRMLTTVTVWTVAITSALLLRRRRRLDPALSVLLLTPFIPLVLQPYGGEGLLRTALFALPASSILIASLPVGSLGRSASPALRRVIKPGTVTLVFGLIAAGLVPILMTTRYGNEYYEAITNDDIALVEALHNDIGPGNEAAVFSLASASTVFIGRLDLYPLGRLSGRDTEAAIDTLRRAVERDEAPVYVVLMGYQGRAAEETLGLDVGWMTEYQQAIRAQFTTELVAQTSDGIVFRVIGNV